MIQQNIMGLERQSLTHQSPIKIKTLILHIMRLIEDFQIQLVTSFTFDQNLNTFTLQFLLLQVQFFMTILVAITSN